MTNSQSTLPATASVGSTGAIDAGVTYHDSTKAVIDQQFSTTYSVASDTPTTVLLCLTGVTSGTTSQGIRDGMSNGTQVACFHVDANANANANVNSANIAVTVGNTVLTFK